MLGVRKNCWLKNVKIRWNVFIAWYIELELSMSSLAPNMCFGPALARPIRLYADMHDLHASMDD